MIGRLNWTELNWTDYCDRLLLSRIERIQSGVSQHAILYLIFNDYFKLFHLVLTHTALGFPGGLDGKESTCNVEDLGSIPGLGRFPGEGHGDPLWYSCLEYTQGHNSLVGYSSGGQKKLDMTEWLSTAHGCNSFLVCLFFLEICLLVFLLFT